MTEAERPGVPVLFAIQLEEVFCTSTRAERRGRVEADAENIKTSRIELSSTELDDDRKRFRSRLEVALVAPVLDQEVAELTVVVQGNFVGAESIDDELLADFVSFTPMVQLYPYARTYLAELGRMLGIALPPLPLITVSQPPAEEDWEPIDEDDLEPGDAVASEPSDQDN